jgi:hypothetical protein
VGYRRLGGAVRTGRYGASYRLVHARKREETLSGTNGAFRARPGRCRSIVEANCTSSFPM